MSNVYSNPAEFGLELLWEADAGEAYEFDKIVIWRRLNSASLLIGTDSGCSCPCPFEDTNVSDLETATPEAVNEWFDSPASGPRRNKVGPNARQVALALFNREGNMKNLDEEIREAEANLELLKTKQANIRKLMPVHLLAIEMHGLLCRATNHSEGCGWYYEIDSKEVHDWTRYAHETALKQAQAAVAAVGEEVAMKFVKAVKDI